MLSMYRSAGGTRAKFSFTMSTPGCARCSQMGAGLPGMSTMTLIPLLCILSMILSNHSKVNLPCEGSKESQDRSPMRTTLNPAFFMTAMSLSICSGERIDSDIAVMKNAGFNVVRMGDLSWDSFEPSQGKFTFEWFDKIMDKMQSNGIRVIVDI